MIFYLILIHMSFFFQGILALKAWSQETGTFFQYNNNVSGNQLAYAVFSGVLHVE